MYPYHNRIRQRINNGELIDFYFTNDYPKIGECLVLVFSTHPVFRPIRPHAYNKYQDIISRIEDDCDALIDKKRGSKQRESQKSRTTSNFKTKPILENY